VLFRPRQFLAAFQVARLPKIGRFWR
jgi:hypothetical protein